MGTGRAEHVKVASSHELHGASGSSGRAGSACFTLVTIIVLLTLAGCAADSAGTAPDDTDVGIDAAQSCTASSFGTGATLALPTGDTPPDANAENLVIYEVQIRSANACDPDVGSESQREACAEKVAPEQVYRSIGTVCPSLAQLEEIRMGTIDDMLEDTADFRDGITLRYIDEAVGANAIWFQPPFPNNDRIRIPTPCDNLGSPYAVRDYFHLRGTLARECILEGTDEYSSEPCWGNDAFDRLIGEANDRELVVMLDVAFNHFGHDYLVYDTELSVMPGPRWESQVVDALWDFEATYDEDLLTPVVLDSAAALDALIGRDPVAAATAEELAERCPQLRGMERVRAFSAWRMALPWERELFACDDDTAEARIPGMFLGASGDAPSVGPGDAFTQDWYDVKFLFLRNESAAFSAEALRNREYLFRVLNYWVSRGVLGFRLDHSTDYYSGLGAEDWSYIIAKVRFYAELRGQSSPVFLAEEFHNQQDMNPVADMMTEGFLFDLAGRFAAQKNAAHVVRVLQNMGRFEFDTLVLAHLENHDELRLVTDTGFDPYNGRTFWAAGASVWSTPMLLMGQEFGEGERLEFRRAHYLPARFEGSPTYRDDADTILDGYRRIIRQRLEDSVMAGRGQRFVTAAPDSPTDNVVALARFDETGEIRLVLLNLWSESSLARFVFPRELFDGAGISPCDEVRFVDTLGGGTVIPCTTAEELVEGFGYWADWQRRVIWSEMHVCE